MESIPLFVRAGSILPMAPVMQHVDEIPSAPYEIRIYRGTDGAFSIYEDAGDTYDYEKDAYSLVTLSWSDARNELLIASRMGSFPEMIASRAYQFVFIGTSGQQTKTVTYTGTEIRISPC